MTPSSIEKKAYPKKNILKLLHGSKPKQEILRGCLVPRNFAKFFRFPVTSNL
jgi:hypothetical protein